MLTRRLRRIHNAWHFRFALNLVFTAQWFRFGGWRCSPLNAALCVFPEFIFLNQKVKIRIAENVSSGLLV
ncbi:hypothetical protein CRN33_19125 [Vibrio vulnificus]|nr:hypothetical protein CRN33_19125 [Vibrio vulnificus]